VPRPHLLNRAGPTIVPTIVNVSSGVGLMPQPKTTPYAASKAGLLGFTRALAMELAPKVRVNAVCPGVTNTPMVADFIKPLPDGGIPPFVQQYALKRVADPGELAQVIAFLTASDSSFVTGATFAADGGRTFH
jgi:NAD(P)-dependent dehydrogenase (short-subunit alcohol dehydrogenase family)